MRASAVTDPGYVRNSNQDYALVRESLFAVADGMGGHAGGDVAARLAIEALERAFDASRGLAGLVQATEAANHEVFHQAESDLELRGMGTTLTVAALVEEAGERVVALTNVGDSRAYLFSDAGLLRLTEDHSVVEEMVRSGELTEAEAATHPHRHIVTRAIGIDTAVDVDAWNLGALASGRLLLCSDGLTNECSEAEIEEILAARADLDATARELVVRALAHGGGDNITVVLVELGPDGGARAGALDGAGAVTGAEATEPPGELAEPAPSPAGSTAALPAALAPGAPVVGEAGAASGLRPAPARSARGRPQSRPATAGELGPARRRRERPAWANEPMVTVRVVLFVLVLLGVLGGAAGFVTWFNNATYYLGVSRGKVAIFEGRPGGMLWFHPVLAYESSLGTGAVLSSDLPQLRQGLLESSYSNARAALARLAAEKSLLDSPTPGRVAPGAAATSTTAPVPRSSRPPRATAPTSTSAART